MKKTLLASLLVTLAAAAGAHAQAPAGAPAGANGICKDGTYSMQATKDGACRGHKGVQTWYVATAAKPAQRPRRPGSHARAGSGSLRTFAPRAHTGGRLRRRPCRRPPRQLPPQAPPRSRARQPRPLPRRPQPVGRPGLVWLNSSSNVYHCSGTTYYGKTKAGSYMSEADAKAKGAHNEGGKPCPAQ